MKKQQTKRVRKMEQTNQTFYAIKLSNGQYLDVDGFGYREIPFSELNKDGLYRFEQTAIEELESAKTELTSFTGEKKVDLNEAKIVPITLSEGKQIDQERVMTLLEKFTDRSDRWIEDANKRDDQNDVFFYEGQKKIISELRDLLIK